MNLYNLCVLRTGGFLYDRKRCSFGSRLNYKEVHHFHGKS
ncbi:hypothetical protein CLOHYLEM_07779 [[Clostridium] hylemonae DSM 15053]|uniref:Uncharacterized protein n=1 Tax=[Clostridium] hylemonae DSM 15053 TaxID=553973 RepID=C0C6P0_9FIRM|nr:hypothetical protein CLOHYLEM_07779 [[Clostridium] hylemonae DSM 15053]